MNDAQRSESLELERLYRRELVHAANVFPNGATIQALVDNAVLLQAVVHSLENDEPYATVVERYATVTEYQGYEPEQEDE